MTYFPVTNQDSVVSFPFLLELSDQEYHSVWEMPRQIFLIKLVDGAARSVVSSARAPVGHGINAV